jgi:autotransporter-associated beta strand protein
VLNGNISENPGGSGRTVNKNNANSTVILGGNHNYTGLTTVAAGTLITNTSFQNTGLSISTAATARISQRATSGVTSGVSVVPSVTIGGTGVLDITNNGLVVDYDGGNPSPLATIQGYLKAGYGTNGSWSGTGAINSSTAAGFNLTNDPHKRAVGFAEASALGISSFLGKAVDGSAIVARYTMNGDANLDGRVNALDFNSVAANFGQNGGANVWNGGDFNYDGNVDTTDFTVIGQNFNQVLPSAPPGSALGSLVPEPSTLMILGCGGMTLVSRRRRRA